MWIQLVVLETLFVSLFSLVAACEQKRAVPEQMAGAHVVATKPPAPLPDTALYAILPASPYIKYIFPNAKPAELSQAELIRIDLLLTHCVAEANVKQEQEYQKAVKAFPKLGINRKNYFINLPEYKRQLVAVITEKGEKEVWVNCFCGDIKADYWRKQEVVVDDGGNCFFNLRINLSTSTCHDLIINGMA